MTEKDSQELDSNSSIFNNIPRKQKIAVFVLFLGAIFIIVFWAWQFNNRLTSPFNNSDTSKKGNNTASSSPLTDSSQVDTDHDGLSDYDETTIYRSSPYLEDTDSDGILDGEETKNGTNPNCATGQVCNGADNTSPVATSTIATSSLISVPELSLPDDIASSSQQILQDALAGKADASTLRSLLLSSGADKTMLDQISDEDLMASYAESLKNQQNQ